MRNRFCLCAAALFATTAAAAAQSNPGCAPDPNPSSVNAGCTTDGLPAVSRPLPDGPSALEEGRLDQGTTSSLSDDSTSGLQSDMPAPNRSSDNPGADDGLSGSSGSVIDGTQGNADISESSSANSRVGGSAITGTSGVSAGSGGNR